MATLKELIQKNRSYRRFYEDVPVSDDQLKGLVDLARLTPSSANLQPLRYMLSSDAGRNAIIFPHLSWAGYLSDWPGPRPGERPSAYIIILLDTTVSKTVNCDHGIAAQTLLLGAAAAGLGGCIIASINKKALKEALSISGRYDVMLVIALGKPLEKVVLETVGPGGEIRYWRDKDGTHHVPKRRLEDIIIEPGE
ncbi:MAG: nitroreductase family protein [Deltaproteobacteria bacterium]|nr:nitroreductase family protein [Deltaproteobacteria bacterium]